MVTNPKVAALLRDGGAYEHASSAIMRLFPAEESEIVAVYRMAIQRVFLVCIAFTGFAFLICLFEKDIPLRTMLVTDYGLKNRTAIVGSVDPASRLEESRDE